MNRSNKRINHYQSSNNNNNAMQQSTPTTGVGKLRPKNKLISNNIRSSSHQLSENTTSQVRQHQSTNSHTNGNMQQSDFKVANELAKCYEEIDQIYDYIRGLAPLPPELRKIKWIDFEQQEKMERAAKQLAAENNLKTQQQQLQQSHRHNQHQPQKPQSADVATTSKRLIPLKVTGGSVTAQVKRVESFNLNNQERALSSSDSRCQQQHIESIRLPRAQSDKNTHDKARLMSRQMTPNPKRRSDSKQVEPAIRMIDSRPASASDDILIPQQKVHNQETGNSLQANNGHASLHSSTVTTSSSASSSQSSSDSVSSVTQSSSESLSESDSEVTPVSMRDEYDVEQKQQLKNESDNSRNNNEIDDGKKRNLLFSNRLLGDKSSKNNSRSGTTQPISATTSASSRANVLEKSSTSSSSSSTPSDYENGQANNSGRATLSARKSKSANRETSVQQEHIYEQIPAHNEVLLNPRKEQKRNQKQPFMYPVAFAPIMSYPSGMPKTPLQHRHTAQVFLSQAPTTLSARHHAALLNGHRRAASPTTPVTSLSRNSNPRFLQQHPLLATKHQSSSQFLATNHPSNGQENNLSQTGRNSQLFTSPNRAGLSRARDRHLSMNNLNLISFWQPQPIGHFSTANFHKSSGKLHTDSQYQAPKISHNNDYFLQQHQYNDLIQSQSLNRASSSSRVNHLQNQHQQQAPNQSDHRLLASQTLHHHPQNQRQTQQQPAIFVWYQQQQQQHVNSLPRHSTAHLIDTNRPENSAKQEKHQMQINHARSLSARNRHNPRRLTAIGIESLRDSEKSNFMLSQQRNLLGPIEAPLIDDEGDDEDYDDIEDNIDKRQNDASLPLKPDDADSFRRRQSINNSVSDDLHSAASSSVNSPQQQLSQKARDLAASTTPTQSKISEVMQQEMKRSKSASSRQRKNSPAESPFVSSSSFIKCYYGRKNENEDQDDEMTHEVERESATRLKVGESKNKKLINDYKSKTINENNTDSANNISGNGDGANKKSTKRGEKLLGLIGLGNSSGNSSKSSQQQFLTGKIIPSRQLTTPLMELPSSPRPTPRVFEHPTVSVRKLPSRAVASQSSAKAKISHQQQLSSKTTVIGKETLVQGNSSTSSLRKRLANVLALGTSLTQQQQHNQATVAPSRRASAPETVPITMEKVENKGDNDGEISDSTSSYEAAIKRGQPVKLVSIQRRPSEKPPSTTPTSSSSRSKGHSQHHYSNQLATASNGTGSLMRVPKLSRQSHLLNRPLPKPPSSMTALQTSSNSKNTTLITGPSNGDRSVNAARALALTSRSPAILRAAATSHNAKPVSLESRKSLNASINDARLVSTNLDLATGTRSDKLLAARRASAPLPISSTNIKHHVSSASKLSRNSSSGNSSTVHKHHPFSATSNNSTSNHLSPLAVAINSSNQHHSSPTVTTCTSSGISSRLTVGTHLAAGTNSTLSQQRQSRRLRNNNTNGATSSTTTSGCGSHSAVGPVSADQLLGGGRDSPFALMDQDQDQDLDVRGSRLKSNSKSPAKSPESPLFSSTGFTNDDEDELGIDDDDCETRATFNPARSRPTTGSVNDDDILLKPEEENLRLFDEKFSKKQKYFDQQLASSRDSLFESMNLNVASNTSSNCVAPGLNSDESPATKRSRSKQQQQQHTTRPRQPVLSYSRPRECI